MAQMHNKALIWTEIFLSVLAVYIITQLRSVSCISQ